MGIPGGQLDGGGEVEEEAAQCRPPAAHSLGRQRTRVARHAPARHAGTVCVCYGVGTPHHRPEGQT